MFLHWSVTLEKLSKNRKKKTGRLTKQQHVGQIDFVFVLIQCGKNLRDLKLSPDTYTCNYDVMHFSNFFDSLKLEYKVFHRLFFIEIKKKKNVTEFTHIFFYNRLNFKFD